MIFTDTPLHPAVVVEPKPIEDDRGFFARAFCAHEFEAQKLNPRVVQCNLSFNRRAGTLRGLHYQHPPHGEVKLIRCTVGALYDVIVDVRPDSPTFRQYFGIELSARNRKMLYVPEGFAHGFQTLQDDTEAFYQVSEFYTPGAAGAVRWNDPAFGIAWPLEVTVISEQDRTCPDFTAPPR